jgi:hypothetical protein
MICRVDFSTDRSCSHRRSLDKRRRARQVVTMPQTCFHFSPARLAPGSVIFPGNWGRIIRRYTYPLPDGRIVGNPWVIAREMQFEMVRLAHFSAKPSRLEAAFCCPDVEHARAYQSVADLAGIQALHEVELVDAALATHVAPLVMIDFPTPGSVFIDQTIARAMAYWAGSPEGVQEIVTLSPLRVVSNID